MGQKCIFSPPIISQNEKCVQRRETSGAGCASLVHCALAPGTVGCVAVRGNNRIPDSFLTASQWPIFWRNARAEKKKTRVKLCQRTNPSSVCLPCCCVSFVSGLIVAREEFLHLPHMHTCMVYIFQTPDGLPPPPSLFASESATLTTQTPSHTDLLYATVNHWLCTDGRSF